MKQFRFISLFLLLICLNVFASNQELKKINLQISKTSIQNENLIKKIKVSTASINKTRKNLINTTEKVQELELQKYNLEQNITNLDKEQFFLEKKLIFNKKEIENAISVILFLASNRNYNYENMRDYVLTSVVFSGLSEQFNEEIKVFNKKILKLADIIKEKEKEKEKLEKLFEVYKEEKTNLDDLLNTRRLQNESLKKEQFIVQIKLKELKKQARNLEELSNKVGSKMVSSKKLSYRKLQAPVKGNLVLEYGEEDNIGWNSTGWRIKTRPESLVISPADGKIVFADNFNKYGTVVIIEHNYGYKTILTNLGVVSVLVGQEVLAGEPIARTESNSKEMLVEVRKGANTIDPATIFKKP